MSHVLEIGVTVDDEAISKAVIEEASKKVSADIEAQIFEKRYYGTAVEFTRQAEKIIQDVVNSYKEEIIEIAANKVAESIKHSKAYKETLKTITEQKG